MNGDDDVLLEELTGEYKQVLASKDNARVKLIMVTALPLKEVKFIVECQRYDPVTYLNLENALTTFNEL